MFNLKTHVLIWVLFMSTTVKSAIHLGLEYAKRFGSIPEPQLWRDQDVVPWLFESGKVHVCSDSVLCIGRVHQLSEVNTKWKEPIHYVEQFFEDAVLPGIDGERIEFEWNISPGFTLIQVLRHTQSDLNARRRNPDQFEGRMKFMAVFNDILSGQRKQILIHVS